MGVGRGRGRIHCHRRSACNSAEGLALLTRMLPARVDIKTRPSPRAVSKYHMGGTDGYAAVQTFKKRCRDSQTSRQWSFRDITISSSSRNQEGVGMGDWSPAWCLWVLCIKRHLKAFKTLPNRMFGREIDWHEKISVALSFEMPILYCIVLI